MSKKEECKFKHDSDLFQKKPCGWTKKQYITALIEKDKKHYKKDQNERMAQIIHHSDYGIIASGCRNVDFDEMWAIFHIINNEENDDVALQKLKELYNHHPKTMMINHSYDQWYRDKV